MEMEIEIKKQLERPLLSRKEIIASITSNTTHSAEEVKRAVAEKLNKAAEFVVVKKIDQKFGLPESEAEIYIYESTDALKKFEPQRKKKEAKEKQEEKPETAATKKEK